MENLTDEKLQQELIRLQGLISNKMVNEKNTPKHLIHDLHIELMTLTNRINEIRAEGVKRGIV